MTSREIELQRLRRRLETLGPDERFRAEAIAVYAVATAERLGWDDERLFSLRIGANLPADQAVLLDLARTYVEARWGLGGSAPRSASEARRVLERESAGKFPPDLINAFLQIEDRIHPLRAPECRPR